MQSLAIIGTGIAGMGCAHLLQKRYDITLFEKNEYTGGHTNTVTVSECGHPIAFDTGFMVFNYETYPRLTKLFSNINAPVIKTDMSFSVQHVPTGLEYSGSGFNGLFAQRKNLLSYSFIRMLKQINRFNKESIRILDDPEFAGLSLQDFINAFGFSKDMLWKYLIPMSSAVWSAPMDKMLNFPAQTLIRFFYNHGFLGLNTQHQWYTLDKGSQSYRELLIAPFRHRILNNLGVKSVVCREEKVLIKTFSGQEHLFDKVIFACHADEALALLEEPTGMQQTLLKPFHYQENITTIHTDENLMPKTRRAWSSWNYRIIEREGTPIPTTIYWMNSLQKLNSTKNYFVSVSDPHTVNEEKVIRRITYQHPLFDVPAIRAQKDLHRLNEHGPLYFCGSYFNYGFHEDAYVSALNLCEKIK
ncbi:MAG: NAD(P)/FAD-dependent oxidoreductase [Bacteroidia bacterium]